MDYTRIAQVVVKQIASYGRDVTLRQFPYGAATYDPTSLTVSAPTSQPVETVVKGLVTDQPGKRIGPQYGTNMKKDTLIEDGQKWIYIDGMGPRPKPNDKIVIGDVEYTVDDVQETAPGDVVLFYLVVLYR
jgi:hypothetical protein